MRVDETVRPLEVASVRSDEECARGWSGKRRHFSTARDRHRRATNWSKAAKTAAGEPTKVRSS